MIRYEVLGFVDHDAAKQHTIVLRQHLEMAAVRRLVEEMGETFSDGNFSVDGHPFIPHDGYLSFPSPVARPKAVEFIVRLAREAGCDIADIELGAVSTPDDFRTHCERMSQLRAPSPFGQ